MFDNMSKEEIVKHARDKGLGEVEASELASLASQRIVDSTRQDFERYWHLVEKLGK